MGLLVILFGLILWKRPDNAIRIATASISDVMCSGVFVSGLSPERAFSESFSDDKGLRPLMRGLLSRRPYESPHHDGLARSLCRHVDVPPGIRLRVAVAKAGRNTLQAVHDASGSPETQPIVVSGDPLVRDALTRAFVEPATGARRHVHAIVVMHDGKIVAEQYASGFGPDTPLLAYSASESVVNALVGILVKQGRLDVHSPAPVKAWSDPADPRHALAVDQLMRMTSGLALTEDDSGFDPVSIMMFQKPDMANYAAQSKLTSTPGTVWDYSSGSTLIVSGILRDTVGDGAASMIRFAHKQLFDPIGMQHVLMEFDGAQTLIGSTRIYASARDWARFGQLYLDDGVVNGQRILPAGWAAFSASPTLDAPYGAGFWTNVAASGDRQPRIDGLPPDAYFASGMNGQRIVIVPSRHLIVVRFGSMVDPPRFDMKGLIRLVTDISGATR